MEQRLTEFTRARGIPLSDEQRRALVALDALLTRFSRAVGLSALHSPSERFARYFAEALHASLWAPPAGPAWDLGTGGGTPALPLAILRPALRFTLVEPNRRKGVFLEEAVRELGLSGCRVVRARLQEIAPEQPVALITSRGLAAAGLNLARLGEWLDSEGRILLFSGRDKARRLVLPEGLERVETVALAPDHKTRLLVIRRARARTTCD